MEAHKTYPGYKKYHIALNFRGSKFSQIVSFEDFVKIILWLCGTRMPHMWLWACLVYLTCTVSVVCTTSNIFALQTTFHNEHCELRWQREMLGRSSWNMKVYCMWVWRCERQTWLLTECNWQLAYLSCVATFRCLFYLCKNYVCTTRQAVWSESKEISIKLGLTLAADMTCTL